MRQRRLRILVTAGPTREYLDRVRYLSNESSGRMGFALAAAALQRGHHVTLIHGPVALRPPRGARCVPVVSAREMLAACEQEWPAHDVLIMAAAVADYTPLVRFAFKRKKAAEPVSVRLVPTVDILSRLSASRTAGQVVIGFALEDRAPRRRAREKLRRKRLDAIILNPPSAMSAPTATIELLVPGAGWRTFSGTKLATARQLLRAIEPIAEPALRDASTHSSRFATRTSKATARDSR
ncbi:MAG: phosphopantothenoylcysteine decarboxylase [Phycisphaerae bacterium]|jgi:phosphopantothenoylcysteine decarboxylase/phosphopantothenate--cysteine ligase